MSGVNMAVAGPAVARFAVPDGDVRVVWGPVGAKDADEAALHAVPADAVLARLEGGGAFVVYNPAGVRRRLAVVADRAGPPGGADASQEEAVRVNLQLFTHDPTVDDTGEWFEDLPADPVSEAQARSTVHRREFDEEAFAFIETAGARVLQRYVRVFGYRLDAVVEGANGARFYLGASGTPDRTDRPQAGMRRQDTMLKFGFKALRLAQRGCPHPVLLVTSHLPRPNSAAAYLLSELNDVLFDAVATTGDLAGQRRLVAYFTASRHRPLHFRRRGGPSNSPSTSTPPLQARGGRRCVSGDRPTGWPTCPAVTNSSGWWNRP